MTRAGAALLLCPGATFWARSCCSPFASAPSQPGSSRSAGRRVHDVPHQLVRRLPNGPAGQPAPWDAFPRGLDSHESALDPGRDFPGAPRGRAAWSDDRRLSRVRVWSMTIDLTIRAWSLVSASVRNMARANGRLLRNTMYCPLIAATRNLASIDSGLAPERRLTISENARSKRSENRSRRIG